MLKRLVNFFLMFNGISTKGRDPGVEKWERVRAEEEERERRAAEARARATANPQASEPRREDQRGQ